MEPKAGRGEMLQEHIGAPRLLLGTLVSEDGERHYRRYMVGNLVGWVCVGVEILFG